ncbi:carbohydrate porin [Zobellella iuensis]|uniref:Carbohydrate porin n=1 Tax=Zobellella iuensis TaxID=2803811 RepID=A0ABS1QNI5_9GAMM|nr:carbohydrate porin [Zobellella iuensis]MBL1376418.1 carbohydrate porin [Zobellella iuensis]
MTRKALLLGLLVAGTAATANAEVTWEGNKGRLSLGGDVEFDINAANKQEDSNLYMNDGRNDRWDQTGRLLLDVSGERVADSGAYAKFKAQPTLGSSGGVGSDDAWFAFGRNDVGEMKIGRFEALDLFPLGQDVFVEHSGDTSSGLYTDGSAYLYMAKEARGRAGDAGHVMVSRQLGDLYLELATLFGNRLDLFNGAQYHGHELTKKKDSIVVRPAMRWQLGDFSWALGAEHNLVDDAIIDDEGRKVARRTGYGTTFGWQSGVIKANLNAAYLDALNEENLTLGANVLFNQFGLGYIYGRNKIDEAAAGFEYLEGTQKSNTVYTSYRFDNVLDLDNFGILLGAYWSDFDVAESTTATDRYGARVRFKYVF